MLLRELTTICCSCADYYGATNHKYMFDVCALRVLSFVYMKTTGDNFSAAKKGNIIQIIRERGREYNIQF